MQPFCPEERAKKSKWVRKTRRKKVEKAAAALCE
jgi:hypothetical protein